MKLKKARLPITDFINRNKISSICINFIFTLFFSLIRLALKPFKYSNGNLVVISLHRLGDTIFTIPAIRELQKLYGQKIHIFCFQESIPIYQIEFNDLQLCPVSHDEFCFGQRFPRHSAKSKLKYLKPEIILDLTGTMISATLIYNIKAKQIIGINRKQFASIYDVFIPVREEPQLVDIYLDAISPFVKLSNRNELKKQRKQINPKGKILIHPFAGWEEKEWNLRNFITLAKRLTENYSVSLIAQTNQISNDIVNEINHSGIELVQTNNVEDLVKNINDCSLFIGNDSGPVNIANFLGKPTFSIYGATNPDYTISEEDHQRYIQKKLNCSAEQKDKYCTIGVGVYDCPGVQCMELLSVEEVYENVISLIKEYCNSKT
jgi:ADP-heptose:LPS heptosyltransferase